jgi:hypothetical protein
VERTIFKTETRPALWHVKKRDESTTSKKSTRSLAILYEKDKIQCDVYLSGKSSKNKNEKPAKGLSIIESLLRS